MNKRFGYGMLAGFISATAVMGIIVIIYIVGFSHDYDAFAKSGGADANTIAVSANDAAVQVPANAVHSNDNGQNVAKPAVELSKERQLFDEKLTRMMDYIDYYYVDPVDKDQLYDAMLHSMVKELNDPYSCYYSEKEYKDIEITNSGDYCGIGATVTQTIENKKMYILQPYDGSPAKKAGVLPMDEIVAIDDVDVIGWNLDDAVSMLRGPENTHVKLTVLRAGEGEDAQEERISFDIIREKITIIDVYPKMLEDNIGYIYISSFEGKTAEQFKTAVDNLLAENAKGLIIDLRDNGGGLLDAAVQMVDYLIPDGELIVYTKDKYGNCQYEKSKSKHSVDIPIVILVNESTASASEIFLGAMTQNGHAYSVGTKSFGKGIVQYVIPLEYDKSAIKLTAMQYFTPDGICIHGEGITPNIIEELNEGLYKIAPKDREEDNQRDKAVELLKSLINN